MTHHGAGLRQELIKDNQDSEIIDALISDLEKNYQKAKVTNEELAALEYAEKLTIFLSLRQHLNKLW